MPSTYDPKKHHRRSVRLKEYDYSLPGAYFVTICAHDRGTILGAVSDGEMHLNDAGLAVRSVWTELPLHYPHVELDAFVIMPNHVHGIIVLTEVGAGLKPAPANARPPEPNGGSLEPAGAIRHALPEIVRAFKTFSSRKINHLQPKTDRAGLTSTPPSRPSARSTPASAIWQRNYYEHVIRNEKEWDEIAGYIVDNPLNWPQDSENPQCPHRAPDFPFLPSDDSPGP